VRVASHQPNFLPWAGYWHKVLSADLFIVCAGVQWPRHNYANRIEHGGSWITVPVESHSTDKTYLEVRVSTDAGQLQKLRRRLAAIVAQASHRDRLQFIDQRLAALVPGGSIYDLNLHLIRDIAKVLGTGTVIVVDRERDAGGTTTERLRQMVVRGAPGVTEYLMGPGALDYFDPVEFGIPVKVQDPSAFSGRSILDVLGSEPDPVDYLMHTGAWADLESRK
jgi:hypothetical protein